MSYFEGRRRWRSRKENKERTPAGRGASMTAIMRGLVILMFGILIVQLVNLQVIKGEQYREQAEINALREIPIPANRGLIYDRNGTLLVQNTARFSATIIPGDLPDGDEATAYRMISNVIGLPASEIEARVIEGIEVQGEFNPTVIKGDLDREVALTLIELQPHVPGLSVQVEPSRNYLTGDLLSHILGYIGPISAEEYETLADEGYLYQDFLGKSGVELEESKIDIFVNDIHIVHEGLAFPFFRDVVVSAMAGDPVVRFQVSLNLGDGAASGWGCDLTEEYVTFNSAYST